MSHHLKYRPHIDGLRAIAVISVVLFHLGLGFLPGGFAGVDIFFVISGFLISRIIYTEALAGEFSVVRFYERRARRILPAFFAVTILTFLGVYFLFLPPELEEYAKSTLAALAFVPNIFFYATADYFAPAAETMPALHYWSLGVEEQFYFVFPLIVLGIIKVAPRALPLCLGALLVVSLIASEAVLRSDPQAAFYLLPFRAFELLVGCLIALPNTKFPTTERSGAVATGAGLCLILASFLLLSKETRFPGVAALLPTVGAGLILWGSDRAANPIARLLGSRPMVAVGLISYSLYLVHWPVILFAGRLFPYADPLLRGLGVLTASVLLAALSYYLVERPLRQKAWIFTRARIFAISASGLTVLGTVAGFVLYQKGFPNRLDGRVKDILAFQSYDLKPQFRSRVCFLDPEQLGQEINFAKCLPQTGMKKAILWGDSTAAHLYLGMREPLEAAGYSLGQLTASACPPTIDLDVAARPNCRGFNDIVLPRIIEEKPDLVIMAAGWVASDVLLAHLDASIAKLREAGITPVVLGSPPFYRGGVPALLAERLKKGDHTPLSGSDLNAEFSYGNDGKMKAHFANRQDARLVSILDTVCPQKQCPMIIDNKIPIHFDPLHLTPAGSKYFARALAPQILN